MELEVWMRSFIFSRGGRAVRNDETVCSIHKERVPALTDPVGMLVNRVKQELDTTTSKRGKKKYYLFTNIPKRPHNKKQRR